MKTNLPLPQEKKLAVIYRVEPGCLGPKGADHIEKFCIYAQKEFETVDSDFIHWEIMPRHDKSLPEMQYKVGNKNLTHDKAAKYLEIFEKELDVFEGRLHRNLSMHIDTFLGR